MGGCPSTSKRAARSIGPRPRAGAFHGVALDGALALPGAGGCVGGEAVGIFQFANLAIWSAPISAVRRLRVLPEIRFLARLRH